MVIIDWFRWKRFLLRHEFTTERLGDGRYCVVMYDRWEGTHRNISGRLLSKANAEELIEELKTFKTFRDSKTEEGRDFDNPQVKAWLKRQRRRKIS